MAKFKVYELAKEVEKSSKEILAFLQEKGIEAKGHQSSVEEDTAEMVRKHFGAKTEVKAEAPKAEAPKAEAPKAEDVKKEETAKTEAPKKKKNIVFVSNPQYSKMPGGNKPAMKNNNNHNGNNNNQKANNKPVQEAKPAPKPIQLGPNQMINKSTGKVMEMLPPKKVEVVEEPVVVKEEKAPVKPNRDNRDNRDNRENRNGQDRTNNNQNRSNDRNNERGNDRNFSKPQGEDRRTGDRGYAGKQGNPRNNNGNGDRQNGGNFKGSNQGNANFKDSNRNFKDNDRNQGRNERQDSKFQSKKESRSFAQDAPLVQNDKHREEQRRLNQAKDKRSKKDAL